MASVQDTLHDYELIKSHWRLVPHSKRPYWDAETLEFVRRVVAPHLQRTRSQAELVELLALGRQEVADELGEPPWNR